MVRRPLLTLCAFIAVASVACSSGDSDSAESPSGTVATAAPETTTTTERERTVEEEVEAAYLRSWDVFAHAALELDTTGLEEHYAGPALEVVRSNIDRYIANNTPVRFDVEHGYEIAVDSGSGVAEVRDTYVNHSVLLDPESMAPTEADPNETLTEIYLMQLIEGMWKVVDISRE